MRTRPGDDKRYLLVLCAARDGAWRKIHGSVEVRGGKVERIDVEPGERAAWLEVLKTARVAIEAAALKPERADDS